MNPWGSLASYPSSTGQPQVLVRYPVPVDSSWGKSTKIDVWTLRTSHPPTHTYAVAVMS